MFQKLYANWEDCHSVMNPPFGFFLVVCLFSVIKAWLQSSSQGHEVCWGFFLMVQPPKIHYAEIQSQCSFP